MVYGANRIPAGAGSGNVADNVDPENDEIDFFRPRHQDRVDTENDEADSSVAYLLDDDASPWDKDESLRALLRSRFGVAAGRGISGSTEAGDDDDAGDKDSVDEDSDDGGGDGNGGTWMMATALLKRRTPPRPLLTTSPGGAGNGAVRNPPQPPPPCT